MHITETFIDRSLNIESDNVFDTILSINDFVSRFGHTNTIDQSFQTNGPQRRAKMIFELVKHLDSRTSYNLLFKIFGENDSLSVRMQGSVSTVESESKGFVSSVWNEFYFKRLYKDLRSRSEKNMNEIIHAVKKEFA
ncbi:MAG: hypothetical protein ABIG30_01220 [Candidatus Aenigmatarchaeota archaeon]